MRKIFAILFAMILVLGMMPSMTISAEATNISIANYAFSSSDQRSVALTIHAPSAVMDCMKARIYWSAEYEEWNG